MHPPVNPKQVCAFLGLFGYYRKFIKNLAKIAKPLTVLTRMDVKFEWKETHRCAFMKLKDTIIQAPILRYPNTTKPYIVYMDASDDACRAQLSQMHEEAEIPSSLPITYVHRYPTKMEYTRTRSIQHLFCHQEMELLPTRSRHYSKK